MKHALLMVVTAGLLIAGDTPKSSEAKKEVEKFQGKWVAIALEQEGMEVPAAAVKKANMTLLIKSGKLTFTTPKGTQEGTVRVDPAKKPRTIDFSVTSADGKKETILGIYEWEGETLRIAADKEKRPTEFKSKKDGPLVMTLKRVD